jgi:tetraacyldisaccharide 4'-kinase
MDLPLPIRILLWPLSWIYGSVARWRVYFYEKGLFKKKRLKAAVISVGNLTVGGTGKTPMVLYLAERFLAEGKRVGILSRGYRGSAGTSDEIELLKQRLGNRAQFGVGANRYAQGSKIEKEAAVDVFLLDDGFQHLQLARDVDIVLWDGSKKMQKQWLLPAGTLREPISAIQRADILVVTRRVESSAIEATEPRKNSVFCARTKLIGFRKLGQKDRPSTINGLSMGPFLAFCGVGNPAAFFNDLKSWQIEPAETMTFRDHHRYSEFDVSTLTAGARQVGATAFITTEKDEQNLRGVDFGDFHVYVAVIEFELSPAAEFHAELERLLGERWGTSA